MRKIAIIVGSKSDLSQCGLGLSLLKKYQEEKNDFEVVGIYVRSQHRNILETQELLRELSNMKVNVAIIGAGWANHLTGCCDAFLRYTLKDDRLVVIGVGFSDPENEAHTKAAILSMTDGFVLAGENGFTSACTLAMYGPLPKIKIPDPRPTMDLSLEEALKM